MSKHKHESEMHRDNSAFPSNVDDSAGLPAEPSPEKRSLSGESSAEPSQAPSDTAAVSAELEAARQEIAALRSEVAELNEKYLRKLADEVNFRKRMLREKEESQKFAVSSILADLIPILDDFERGIASSESGKSYEQLHEGVILIKKQLSQMLENKYALKRFESKGTLFDPNRHEALSAEPDNVEEPVVSEEYLAGYTLHDRVLRTAKVRVKIPAPRPVSQEVPREPADQAEVDTAGSAGNADQSER